MIKQPRTFSPKDKAMVVLDAIKGDKTIAQISSDFQVHPTQIGLWKNQAIKNFAELFKDNRKKEKQKEFEHQAEMDNLYKIIGQREIELKWLKKNCQYLNCNDLKLLIEKNNEALSKSERKPEIFNSDQGSHFTNEKFIGILENEKISISVNKRGRFLDNIFVKQL